MLHFTTFHNVSMWVKWPQKLVMNLSSPVTAIDKNGCNWLVCTDIMRKKTLLNSKST